jgi:hypothetical protein
VTTVVHRRRDAVAAYAGFVAFSAYAGAVGLVTGALDTGPTIEHRLPLHSPVLGGIALALVVGVPATVLSERAWRGQEVGRAAVVAGSMLIAWIAIEVAFIREFSWLQVFYTGVGVSFIALGAGDR